MNKKETAQVLALLDACIDHAGEAEIMISLNAVRSRLLQSWQMKECAGVDGELLIEELSALPALCREGYHPALPMKLTRAMFLLHPPAANPEQRREQAARIRCLRSWREPLAKLLVHYDEENAREVIQLLELQLTMMTEVFAQLLTVARGQTIARTAQHRARRLEEIAAVRKGLSLQDVSDTQMDAWTACEMTNEKLSEFAAEIDASAALLQVREPQQRTAEETPKGAAEELEE